MARPSRLNEAGVAALRRTLLLRICEQSTPRSEGPTPNFDGTDGLSEVLDMRRAFDEALRAGDTAKVERMRAVAREMLADDEKSG